MQNHRKVHLEVITIQEENDSGLNECGYRKMNFRIIFTILGKNGKWTGCKESRKWMLDFGFEPLI